jgi:hypothetical protein
MRILQSGGETEKVKEKHVTTVQSKPIARRPRETLAE